MIFRSVICGSLKSHPGEGGQGVLTTFSNLSLFLFLSLLFSFIFRSEKSIFHRGKHGTPSTPRSNFGYLAPLGQFLMGAKLFIGTP